MIDRDRLHMLVTRTLQLDLDALPIRDRAALRLLTRADAAPLITLSHRIAGESACAQARDIRALQRSAARLVGAHKVPSALQATFLRGVNALAAQAPPCMPAAPPISKPAPGRGHGHGKHGHGDGGGD